MREFAATKIFSPTATPIFTLPAWKRCLGLRAGGVAASVPAITLARPASASQPAGPDANPGSGTLTPTPGASITWTGTAAGGTAPDEASCIEGVNCDTFVLTLSGAPGDWHEKTARITFTWPNAVDDYDIYVHKGAADGEIVDDSATGDQPEVINLDPENPSVGTGVFYVHVVYFAVVPPAQQYTAVATVIDQSNPGTAPTCAVVTATGNNPPTVDAGADYKIPARTPFALTANGSDPDGNPITYCWEEADLGPAPKDANTPDDGQNPIFRSFPPTPNPTRIFPQLQYVLNNANTPPVNYPCPEETVPCVTGEMLPTTSRVLNFRVTARDNIFGGHSIDAMKIDVIDSGAGFAVTSPNTAVSIPGGSTQTVTWDIANSTTPDINTTHVNIALTTDGGNTYVPLATNVPNDGSESVVIPNVNSTTARIKVEAVGNIFFDISNENFSIVSTIPPQAQLLNISSRSRVQTADNVLIGGFIVTGTDPKQVMLRAIGPSMTRRGHAGFWPHGGSSAGVLQQQQHARDDQRQLEGLAGANADRSERHRADRRPGIRHPADVNARQLHRGLEGQERHHRHRARGSVRPRFVVQLHSGEHQLAQLCRNGRQRSDRWLHRGQPHRQCSTHAILRARPWSLDQEPAAERPG